MRFVVLLQPFRHAAMLVGPDHVEFPEPGAPEDGVLLYAIGDRPPTFFDELEDVARAIARSLEYAQTTKFDWRPTDYEVVTEDEWATIEELKKHPRRARGPRKSSGRRSTDTTGAAVNPPSPLPSDAATAVLDDDQPREPGAPGPDPSSHPA